MNAPYDEWMRSELERLSEQGLHRRMRLVEGQGRVISVDGTAAVNFSSNNYLGLAENPRLAAAAAAAAAAFGASSGASRLVCGNLSPHVALEGRIAAFKGTERALVFNSGYAANTGILQALLGRNDVVFCDRLNHASIIDGCLLSRARLVRYPHGDVAALRRLLAQNATDGVRLIVTDGVFSMDGDIAPLGELARLRREYGALLMVDDAHGTGVLGDGGRGTAETLGIAGDVDIHMGTLGKALGSFGAYAAGSATLIDFLLNRARSFIFSTSLPPAVLAASREAFDIVDSEEGRGLREHVAALAALLRRRLQEAGLDTAGSETQIVPVPIGDAARTMRISARLLENGFFVQGIRPPTVPTGTARLRCTVAAFHTEEDVERLATEIVRAVGESE